MSTDISWPIDRLAAEGVLVETDIGIQLTDQFRKTRDRHKSALEDPDALESVQKEFAAFTSGNIEPDTGVFANARALEEEASLTGRETQFQIAFVLDRFDGDTPVSGVPDGFVPIEGDEIEQYLDSYPASVLYFWREECSPCDTVRESLEQLLDEGDIPDFVGRAAVYGPDWARLIHKRYDVAVAPTLLFTVGGEVDSRYVGPKGVKSYRSEIEIIAESQRP